MTDWPERGMSDPDEIRAQVAAVLAQVPPADAADAEHADVETIAAHLEEAHDLLVRALESVER